MRAERGCSGCCTAAAYRRLSAVAGGWGYPGRLRAADPVRTGSADEAAREARTGDANAAEVLDQALARTVVVKVDDAFFRGGGSNGLPGCRARPRHRDCGRRPAAGLEA